MRPTNSGMMWVALALLASTIWLTGCSSRPPTVHFTGTDYIELLPGQSYTNDTPLTQVLATPSVIQRKDDRIRALIEALRKMEAQLHLRSEVH
jgi:uncharacterized lipoprotein YmbA